MSALPPIAALLRQDNGTFRIEQVNSDQLSALTLGNVGNEWNYYGAADFNGDGVSDFLLQRTQTVNLGSIVNDWHE